MRCTRCGKRAALLHYNVAEHVDGKCERCAEAEAVTAVRAVVAVAIVAAVVLVLFGLAGALRAEAPQIMPAEELAGLRKILPRVDDADVQAILDDPTTVFYDERSMPPLYLIGGGQQGNQGPLRPADIYKNASRDGRGTEQDKGDGFGGNANVDIPWRPGPGGTNLTPNTRAVKFQWLPKQESGKPWPVVYYLAIYPHLFNRDDRTRGIAMINPVGAVYGELLLQRLPDGTDLPFELRIRRRELRDWAVQVFEPFGTPAELAAEIKRRRPRWTADAFLLAAVLDLESDKALVPDVLAKSFPGPQYARNGRVYTADDVEAIDLKADVDRLLPLNDDRLVQELCLDTVWQDTTDSEWRRGCSMPTVTVPEGAEIDALYAGLLKLGEISRDDVARASYVHVKPARYAGPFLHKNQVDCRECHKHAGLSARSFDQGRGWYGVIRGFDEILSWHPFDPAAYVGEVQPGVPAGPRNWVPALRAEFVAAGLVEQFDPAKHPSNAQDLDGSVYMRLNRDR